MFDLLDMLVVRPIVNILFVIYNFVGDFGLAIIIFTVIVKFAMWPLMKRQLHQTRVMKKIQPELAEIKKRCNGNRQMESLQMMDLYKRNNIKPFRSVVTAFIQFPIFIALFTAINVAVRPCAVTDDYNVAVSRCAKGEHIEYNVEHSAYSFVGSMTRVDDLIQKQRDYFEQYTAYSKDTENKEEPKYDQFKPTLFGVIDLSVSPNQVLSEPSLSTIMVALFALASAATQYIVARQNDPSRKAGGKRRTMRDLLKEAADGKEADQSDINAVAQGQMTFMMPLMMLFIMFNLPGAIVFYYLLNNIITTFLQKIILNRNLTEMENAADKKIIKELKAAEAKEAEIVEPADQSKTTKIKAKKSHYNNANKNKKEDKNVHITRISASDKKKRR